MNRSERPVKCSRRSVSVFCRHVNDLCVVALQVNSRKRHLPFTDIFGQRHAGYIRKHSLKMVRRTTGNLTEFFIFDFACQIFFYIADRLIKPFDPVHTHSPSTYSILSTCKGQVLSFPAQKREAKELCRFPETCLCCFISAAQTSGAFLRLSANAKHHPPNAGGLLFWGTDRQKCGGRPRGLPPYFV